MPFQDYTRLRKLGEGSFGSVYLARNNKDNKLYVQKEVDLTSLGPQGKKEALREVQFLSQLTHPHIIQYKEFFEHDSPSGSSAASGPGAHNRRILSIVMEYADSGDLDKAIKSQVSAKRGVPFPETQILDWFVQICLGLNYMHSKKIIHRDIKAENIFLLSSSLPSPPHCLAVGASAGVGGRVVIGDFGISKTLAHTQAQALTRIGTPYYLSPEICMNRPYAAKSDIWSLGVLLYELCCLRHPFDATSMEGLLHKIVKGHPSPVPKSFSQGIRQLIDSMLQKDPRARPTVAQILKMPIIAERAAAIKAKYGDVHKPVRENSASGSELPSIPSLPGLSAIASSASNSEDPSERSDYSLPSGGRTPTSLAKKGGAPAAPIQPQPHLPPSALQYRSPVKQHQLNPAAYGAPGPNYAAVAAPSFANHYDSRHDDSEMERLRELAKEREMARLRAAKQIGIPSVKPQARHSPQPLKEIQNESQAPAHAGHRLQNAGYGVRAAMRPYSPAQSNAAPQSNHPPPSAHSQAPPHSLRDAREADRLAKEEELTRIRIKYFKERKERRDQRMKQQGGSEQPTPQGHAAGAGMFPSLRPVVPPQIAVQRGGYRR